MRVLLVHGMGRTPISWLPNLVRLRRGGHRVSVFAYSATLQDFARIRDRLATRLEQLAAQGDYAVVGHSLGGVLLRSALNALPAQIALPKHLFLLSSPLHPARLAQRLGRHPLFRLVAGDCGQLLASPERMAGIGAVKVATTSIVGTLGYNGPRSPFGQEPNDGIVALAEMRAEWIADEIMVPVMHTLLPSSRRVAAILLERLAS